MRVHPLTSKVMCDWGTEVGTDDDHEACVEVAVGVVGVKDGPRTHVLSLCPGHRRALVAETDPL